MTFLRESLLGNGCLYTMGLRWEAVFIELGVTRLVLRGETQPGFYGGRSLGDE